MKSNRPADQIVRAVQEGFGGVFTYTPSTPAGSGYFENWDVIRLIGTWGLITCVGLYFAIDDNRCFLTHINSLVDVGEEKTARICNSAEGAAVKQRVLQGLKTSARVDDWDLSAPKITSVTDFRRSPTFITKSANIVVDESSRGFVVDLATSSVTGFAHDRDLPFQRLPELAKEPKWLIAVDKVDAV
ncbi:hypothetical protein LTR37_011935 [Vermiconidia calcicola]|uniref:Uncharacterized protein n=1 Tax=Vermiconidia calcicola TaxID=1690605 RepID=A0ACC3N0W0_9PEZI|nr:hypothetical protein LTR37_011935 [Vermiconidia calcicola]